MSRIFWDQYGYLRIPWMIALLLTVAALFAGGIGVVIVTSSRAVGRTTCRNWSAQTGYETKFVLLNWADTGTCLALAPNGRWVKNTQVLSFANGRKP
jgi:hypothetical protein